MSKWDGILHNSWLSAYRAPFGAVTVESEISLFIRVPDPTVKARLRLWIENGETIAEGTREKDGYRFCVKTPKESGLFWYYFLLDADGQTRSYGGVSGEGRIYAYKEPPAWQITVYEADYTTPEWFKKSVCYQIFPDRFARGAAFSKERAKEHTKLGRRILLHENWEEQVFFRPLPGEQFYDPCDFFGGDLDGVREKLPYLKDLGIDCVYLNPIFESPSNHRYNTSDYEKVDPILGGMEAFSRLLEEAKRMGIEVILDGVFSHTGDDSVYFDKYGRYSSLGAYESRESPYASWYDFISFPENYHSWWGFKTLPELKENDPDYRAFVSKLLARYSCMGVKGWRLDVADELPDEFIKFLRRQLKENNPEGLLLGEVWEDASNKESYGKRRAYVGGQELDSAMGYPFRDALIDFLLYRVDAQGFVTRLMTLREHYPKPFYDAQLNLLGSHDTVRIRTALSGAPGRDAMTREEQAIYKPDEEADRRGRARLMMALMVQMAMPGVPCVYYGDEAGMSGMADPFCRGTYPWGHEDEEIQTGVRKLIHARKACAALSGGACAMRAYGESVFAMLRSENEDGALLLLNRSESSQVICVSKADFSAGPDIGRLEFVDAYRDVLTGTEIKMAAGGIHMVLSPLSAALLISQKPQ